MAAARFPARELAGGGGEGGKGRGDRELPRGGSNRGRGDWWRAGHGEQGAAAAAVAGGGALAVRGGGERVWELHGGE